MLVAISEPKNYRFASPYTMRHDTREAVSVHDVQFLFSRKAAPRLERPEQFAIRMANGREMEVTGDQWWSIYHAARADRNFHWSPSRSMDGDRWSAKWAAIRLDANEYGRLLESDNA